MVEVAEVVDRLGVVAIGATVRMAMVVAVDLVGEVRVADKAEEMTLIGLFVEVAKAPMDWEAGQVDKGGVEQIDLDAEATEQSSSR